MIIKGRSPQMRHVSPVASCALDWLFQRVSLESNVSVRYVHTNQRIADISAKGSFTREKWDELMILIGKVSEFHHCSHHSIVATLFLLVHKMAKRSRPSVDEASKFTSASSNSKPACKRILALAAVRHHGSSPLSVAQKKKTQSDVKRQEHPSQA